MDLTLGWSPVSKLDESTLFGDALSASQTVKDGSRDASRVYWKQDREGGGCPSRL
jgi:hypothetical protein